MAVLPSGERKQAPRPIVAAGRAIRSGAEPDEPENEPYLRCVPSFRPSLKESVDEQRSGTQLQRQDAPKERGPLNPMKADAPRPPDLDNDLLGEQLKDDDPDQK